MQQPDDDPRELAILMAELRRLKAELKAERTLRLRAEAAQDQVQAHRREQRRRRRWR